MMQSRTRVRTFGASALAVELARQIVQERGLRMVSVSNKDLCINVAVCD